MPAPAGDGGRLLLVDGHSLLYRAFYALPPLSNDQGQPTNAVHGFFSMLLRLLSQEQPTHLAVAMDLPDPTFRHVRFEKYKAHRPEVPDELRSQIPILGELLEALGLAVYQRSGYEADDIIGTLALQSSQYGVPVLIVTGDRDALQLVGEGVDALIMRRGISDFAYYDTDRIKQQFGVRPELLVDVKALMGDKSDNIPGVPGVGEKTALALVKSLGTVQNILGSLDLVGGKKLPQILEQYKEQALLSKDLARICVQVPVELDLAACIVALPSQARVRDSFLRYGLRSLLERLPDDQSAQGVRSEGQGQQVKISTAVSPEQLVAAVGAVRSSLRPGVPLGLWAMIADDELVGVGLSPDGDAAWAWLCDGSGHSNLSSSQVVAALLDVADPAAEGAGFGVKPLLLCALRSGQLEPSRASCAVPGWLRFDAAVAAYLLDPARAGYSLSGLSIHYLDLDVPSQADFIGRGRRTRNLRDIELAEVASFFGLRACACARLPAVLRPQLVDRELETLFDEVEMPLIPVLARMELDGVLLDSDALADMATRLEAQLAELEEEIFAVVGRDFNINSPQQLAVVLFDDLALQPRKRTKTGFSTDAEVLEELAAEHPVPAMIIQYRQLSKLLGTYVQGLSAQVVGSTGRIHTTFNQTVTATGRLSTSEPNLQSIPVREAEARQLRRAFIAPDGCSVLAADYSQIELRLLAHLSGDELLIRAFLDEEDIHTRTAMEVFGVEQVDRTMRDAAKAVNFGIIYGMSDFGLSRALKISREEAHEYIQRYFSRYPRVRFYLGRSVETARKRGFAMTHFGRIRQLPEINSRNWQRRSMAERMAMNTPIQGTAADIIKMAMIRVQRQLDTSDLHARLVLQVHDELILEAAQDQVELVRDLVVDAMETVADLAVPLKVDVGWGRSWYEVKGE